MRVLVVIASYGTTNDSYLSRVLEEYRMMREDPDFVVDIVVLSNIPKNLGADIQVVVGLPTKNPYSLPFGHKKLLSDRRSDYDLFIYSEDDILITRRNINAFLRATEILPENEIAGFLHAETDGEGTLYFCGPHEQYHWDPGSVRTIAEYTIAYFTNEHSASFLLTQRQLQRAIESGGFQVGLHEGRYQLRETAATDPYTQCGFKKMICVSHLNDFIIRNLPNVKYQTRPYRASRVFCGQIETLLRIQNSERPLSLLFDPETKLLHTKWSKSYYEELEPGLTALIPRNTRNVLSIGCGWGATEGWLVSQGMRVVGVPLDSVIASCAEARGVEITYGDFATARKQLANERFDCILLSNVLHLVYDPLAVLRMWVQLLSPNGIVLVSAPNFAQVGIQLRRLCGDPQYRDLGSYEKTRVHQTSHRLIREWFAHEDLIVDRFVNLVSPRAQFIYRWSRGLAGSLVASEFIAVGKKQ